MLPETSLDAVTTVGPGVAFDLRGSFAQHTMMTYATGGDSHVSQSFTVQLEASHDGVNWENLGSAGGRSGTSPTSVNVSFVTRFVRANLVDLNNGGSTAQVVTATIASAVER